VPQVRSFQSPDSQNRGVFAHGLRTALGAPMMNRVVVVSLHMLVVLSCSLAAGLVAMWSSVNLFRLCAIRFFGDIGAGGGFSLAFVSLALSSALCAWWFLSSLVAWSSWSRDLPFRYVLFGRWHVVGACVWLVSLLWSSLFFFGCSQGLSSL
jgi:hypothetical protein